jgi:hypothetical protein
MSGRGRATDLADGPCMSHLYRAVPVSFLSCAGSGIAPSHFALSLGSPSGVPILALRSWRKRGSRRPVPRSALASPTSTLATRVSTPWEAPLGSRGQQKPNRIARPTPARAQLNHTISPIRSGCLRQPPHTRQSHDRIARMATRDGVHVEATAGEGICSVPRGAPCQFQAVPRVHQRPPEPAPAGRPARPSADSPRGIGQEAPEGCKCTLTIVGTSPPISTHAGVVRRTWGSASG